VQAAASGWHRLLGWQPSSKKQCNFHVAFFFAVSAAARGNVTKMSSGAPPPPAAASAAGSPPLLHARCEHYDRRCYLQCPDARCGGAFYPCRLCHDAVHDGGERDAKKAHALDRHAVRAVRCSACGAVAVEHSQYTGDWTRSFEGEESASSIGPRPDPLLSTRYNLRTGMGANPGVSNARLRELRLAQEFVEMNQSSHGAGDVVEHRTREGYKDKQKRKMFERLRQVAERLRLADATLARAQAIFAAFRDNREHVQRLDEAVAAGEAARAGWPRARRCARRALGAAHQSSVPPPPPTPRPAQR
jgi:hypothetical protein